MENKYKELYAKARTQTLETLPSFINEIMSAPQSYESVVYAIAACAIGAAWAADRHPNGGITGWQGSYVMWEFIQEWMRLRDTCGLRLVNYDDMLFPQYDYKFEKTIDHETWEAIQKKARKFLEEDEDAHPKVVRHWKSIANGEVPFGYRVK